MKLRLAGFGTSELALVCASRRGKVTIIKQCKFVDIISNSAGHNFSVNVKEYNKSDCDNKTKRGLKTIILYVI